MAKQMEVGKEYRLANNLELAKQFFLIDKEKEVRVIRPDGAAILAESYAEAKEFFNGSSSLSPHTEL